MSIRLVCDQCAKDGDVLHEIRVVSVGRGERATVHNEYVIAQLHWECIVPFVDRRDKEDEEIPF